jgi:putative transposase
MIEAGHTALSVRRQCELLDLNRASYYYEAASESALNLELMKRMDEEYTAHPFYGRRRMTVWLNQQGYAVNPKRVKRLMQVMGLEAIYPKPRTTVVAAGHKVYPYLLRNVAIVRPNQVWGADITYIRMVNGFMYLFAILDWYSRYVVAWQLSNSLEGVFCQQALQRALQQGKPEIFNTDQGVQFTALDFTALLEQQGVAISMDGKGRALDNIFTERLWRTVKYEDIYLKEYAFVPALTTGLEHYFDFYNHQRPHQALNYRTPAQLYAFPTHWSL